MSADARKAREPLALRGFRTYWVASTIGFAGLSVSTIAVDVLVIEVLDASEAQVGFVRAAQFLPYLLIGLVAGALVDRWRRQPTLVVGNLLQAALVLVIPLLFVLGSLSVGLTAVILFAAGCCGVFIAAAEQAYLPDLVPRRSLVLANARLGQSMTIAQTSGPAAGGLLLTVLSAPLALVATSAARIGTALMIARIRRPEPPPHPTKTRMLRGIAEGVAFVYRHRTLGPLAASTHVWFLANSIAMTVLALFVLRGLGLSPVAYGLVLTAAGVGGLVGALGANAAAARMGEGNTIIVSRGLCALTWVGMALTPDFDAAWMTVVVLCSVQLLYGLSMGLEDPSEMAYRQTVTPRAMLGRVGSTMRSANRTVAVIGALTGGLLAGVLDYRPTLLIVVGIFAAATLVALLSPLRGARVRS
ncbi:MFS transporter [Agrococcus casei]|uniref:MFS transporter n=1 Tax=Agrococcus casei TaxID=343512 RepID=UPI003F8E561C